MIILQILASISACIMVLLGVLYIADWFVCKYRKLKLYGYYTNGVCVWQLIQYDKIQVTLYDIKEDRMICMGLHEFLRDFQFLMADTISSIEYVNGKKES